MRFKLTRYLGSFVFLISFSAPPIFAQPSNLYHITQITSGPADRKWPALNNNGDMVWSELVAGVWQVIQADKNGTRTQITTDIRNHERPVISDDGTMVYFRDNFGSGAGLQVVRRDPGGSESVLEFSTRNDRTGDQRIAGRHFGIASDNTTITYYTFFSLFDRRRFNVSGLGELTDGAGGRGNFMGFDTPDINIDLDIVYADDFTGPGQIYRATTAQPFNQTVIDSGKYPRISDGPDPEIVYIKNDNEVTSKIGTAAPVMVDTGIWADVNNSGTIIYEKVVDGFSQIFLAVPTTVEILDAIDFIDPLSNPPALSIDPDVLASGGQPVSAAATDGVTKLLLRLNAPEFGFATFSFLGLPTEDGVFRSLDGSQVDTSITVSTVTTALGEKAFVIFEAPEGFVRDGISNDLVAVERQLNIDIDFLPFSPSTPINFSQTLTLVRPPILLVHGLWSSAATWDQFDVSLQNHLPGIRVFRVNYQYSNARQFDANRLRPIWEMSARRTQLRSEGIAAVQFDIFGHSMDGVLSRIWAGDVGYKSHKNYGMGDINTLVTVDSPHFGSFLADILVELRDGLSPKTKAFITSAFRTIKKPIDEGAIDDLTTFSPPIAQMVNTSIDPPGHAIIGDAPVLLGDLSNFPGPLGKIFKILKFAGLDTNPAIIPPTGSDIIVSTTSQTAGMPPFATTIGNHDHLQATSSPMVAARAVDLLNSPVNGPNSLFHSSFPSFSIVPTP